MQNNDNKRVLLIVNPNARQGQKQFVQATQCLKELGFHVIEKMLDNTQSASEIICQYCHQVDIIVVGGGDGTLNAVLDVLVSSGLPLGILPMGTANDLAKTLGIPDSIPKACQIIAQNHVRDIDLGWVNGKYFLTVACLGLSVGVTRKVTKQSKRKWGMLAYAITFLHLLWHFRPFKAEIRTKNKFISVKSIQIVVGNGRYYAGGMTVSQDAAIDDQKLDLYSLNVLHWWDIFTLLPAIRQGNFATKYNVQTLSAPEIEIYTPKKAYLIDADGELVSQTTAKFRVIPGAISVFCPKPEH